jgi:peptide/nickel transport system substrate-binding protein
MRWTRAGIAAFLVALAPSVSMAQSDLEKSGLVGKLETAEIVTDAARIPKKLQEAPQLAEQVKAGKLPPVEQRVPSEPLVLQPLRSVGKYGGIWRRGFLGPGDSENGNRLRSGDKLIFFDATGTQMRPSVAKGWQVSEDGKTTTIFLRKGMKWSDGSPFTADDFVFWFEDIYSNKDIVSSPAPELAVKGKPGRIVKVDETTVRFEFDEPYHLFLNLLAGDTQIGGGHSRLQSDGRMLGLYAPGHYLKQFLPKYSSLDQVTEKAKAAGYKTWVEYLRVRGDWRFNTELPTVSAWKMVQPINTQMWVLERNPYFWTVDTAGNQLPYLDRIQLALAENPEVINLRAIAGEYDFMERFIDLSKLPVFLDNAQKGNYKVALDKGFSGGDSLIVLNHAFRGDAEIAKWIGNTEFRRALALAIDRDQLNEAFWLGLGVPGSAAPAEIMPESPGPDWRKTWATFDKAKANAMLDKLGLTKKDSEGYRLRTDNGERLRFQIDVVQSLTPTWPAQAEMIVQQWRAVGIAADTKLFERGLFYTRVRNDQHQMTIFSNGGSESMYLYSVPVLPTDPQSSQLGAAHAKWFVSNGADGLKPENAEMIRAFELFRSASLQKTEERNKIAQEIWKIHLDQVFSIGIVGQSPANMGTRVVSNKLENVPERTCISQHCRTPWSGHPEQWFYK